MLQLDNTCVSSNHVFRLYITRITCSSNTVRGGQYKQNITCWYNFFLFCDIDKTVIFNDWFSKVMKKQFYARPTDNNDSSVSTHC